MPTFFLYIYTHIYTYKHLKMGFLPYPSLIPLICLEGKEAGPGRPALQPSALSSVALMLHFCSRNLKKSQQKSALGDEN